MSKYFESPAIRILAKWWKYVSGFGLHYRLGKYESNSILAVNRSSLILVFVFFVCSSVALFSTDLRACASFLVAAGLCAAPLYFNFSGQQQRAKFSYHLFLLVIFSGLAIVLPKAYWHFGNLYVAIAALFNFRRKKIAWVLCLLSFLLFGLIEYFAHPVQALVPVSNPAFFTLVSGIAINVLVFLLIYHYYTIDESGQIWWRESDGLFEAIVEGALDAVVTIHETGKVVAWNNRAVEIFGYTKKEALGRPLHELIIPDSYKTAHIQGMEYYMDTGKSTVLNQRIEIEAVDKSGRIFPVELAITPLPATHADHLFNAFIRDITEIKEARERILEINRELSAFTSIVSHDLQEPLRTIKGFSEILEETIPPDSEEGEYLKVINTAADRMSRMLIDLLNYSKTGKNTLPLERVNLEEVLKNVQQNLLVKIEASKTKLSWEPLPELEGHTTSYLQLFQNLIANAIKFQQTGITPHIHITAQKKAQAWLLGIHDNGIGIDAKHLEGVFEPFHRLHSKDEYEGTGIGLAVCQKIVEQYHGKIWATARSAGGTSFWMEFPFAR